MVSLDLVACTLGTDTLVDAAGCDGLVRGCAARLDGSVHIGFAVAPLARLVLGHGLCGVERAGESDSEWLKPVRVAPKKGTERILRGEGLTRKHPDHGGIGFDWFWHIRGAAGAVGGGGGRHDCIFLRVNPKPRRAGLAALAGKICNYTYNSLSIRKRLVMVKNSFWC